MVGLLRFLKRKRLNHSSSKQQQFQSEGPFKHRSDSASTTCLDDSTEHEEAPWRAAAVLDHTPIQEKDWWTTNLSLHVDDDDDDDDEKDKNVNDNPIVVKQQQQQEGEDLGASQDSVEMHFHNRGYEVWEHCRHEWKHSTSLAAAATVRKPTRPLKNIQRRAVVAGLAKQREYKLPRRLKLEELVQVYQDLWHHDNSE